MLVAQQEYVKHAKKSTLTISELLDGLKEIDRELKATTDKIKEMLEGLHA